MPVVFKETHPTLVIVDVMELKVEVPSSLAMQSQHDSAYKSLTMCKGLVAIAPNGFFVFISQMFVGSISDRSAFSGLWIPNLLVDVLPGKSLMADRGFEVQDLFLNSKLFLIIRVLKAHRKKKPFGSRCEEDSR